MESFTDGDNVHDVHIAEVRFGSDVLLEPWTKRLAKEISDNGEGYRNRDEEQTPEIGPRASHGNKCERCRKKRRRGQIGAASLMDGESAFAGAQSLHRFICRLLNVVFIKVSDQEEAGRVGMSTHGLIREFAGQNVKRCMFHCMVSSSFEYKR